MALISQFPSIVSLVSDLLFDFDLSKLVCFKVTWLDYDDYEDTAIHLNS